MKQFSNILAVVALTLATTVASAAENSRVYIQFKPGQKHTTRALVQQAGGKIHHEFDTLEAMATTLPAAAVVSIRNNPNIARVEEDPPRYLLGCDLPTEQIPYGLDAVQATAVWDANHDGAFDVGAPKGAGIKIGVIDSGVFAGHSDLAGVPMTGYSDSWTGTDWNADAFGHGTHVVGTIAAQVNGSGVAGVSPGVSIHMVKVFDYYEDPYDSLNTGVYWVYSSTLLDAALLCQAAGCKIISMSLGGAAPSTTEQNGFAQLYNAGILLVAAAGNGGDNSTLYPAGYGSVISVAAVDQNNTVASFSQKNSDVELAAPGVNVLSTVPYCEQNSVTGSGFAYSGNPLEYAARATATGILVNGGLGDVVDAAWAGKVVLVERGSITFHEKVMNVQNSGGLACIIYNNVSGDFLGTLQDFSLIPAIGLSLENGQALLARVGQMTTVDTRSLAGVSSWAYYNGTSMATPHVSAAAALIWSSDPAKSNSQVRQSLRATALDLGVGGRDGAYGFGLVQAKAALDYLPSSTGVIEEPDDIVDVVPPIISNVRASAVNARKGTFTIAWTTDEPATSVIVINGTTYSDPQLVTSHSRTFQGRKRLTYTYYVRSVDAKGNQAVAGPFTYRN